jgi:hypothetical protein
LKRSGQGAPVKPCETGFEAWVMLSFLGAVQGLRKRDAASD